MTREKITKKQSNNALSSSELKSFSAGYNTFIRQTLAFFDDCSESLSELVSITNRLLPDSPDIKNGIRDELLALAMEPRTISHRASRLMFKCYEETLAPLRENTIYLLNEIIFYISALYRKDEIRFTKHLADCNPYLLPLHYKAVNIEITGSSKNPSQAVEIWNSYLKFATELRRKHPQIDGPRYKHYLYPTQTEQSILNGIIAENTKLLIGLNPRGNARHITAQLQSIASSPVEFSQISRPTIRSLYEKEDAKVMQRLQKIICQSGSYDFWTKVISLNPFMICLVPESVYKTTFTPASHNTFIAHKLGYRDIVCQSFRQDPAATMRNIIPIVCKMYSLYKQG